MNVLNSSPGLRVAICVVSLKSASLCTQMCMEGADCKRPVCFFAHSEAELREPTPFNEIAALKARLAEESQQAVDAALERIGLGAQRAFQVCVCSLR